MNQFVRVGISSSFSECAKMKLNKHPRYVLCRLLSFFSLALCRMMYVWGLQKAIIFLIIICVMLYVYVNLSLLYLHQL
jgi:hypothetical protein